MHRSILPALLLALPCAAHAAPPSTFDAAAAQRIVDACAREATSHGRSHAIAVVDASGGLLAFLRMDGNARGIGEYAMQKADAVAAWQFSTARMADSAAKTPAFAQAPHVVTMAGGVPVFAGDGRFVGAVGVSGEAPEDDAACASAGIRAAGFSDARPSR